MKSYTQEELKSIAEQYPEMWELSAQQKYDLACIFTEETATPENFFSNSIGFWEERKSRPRIKPDYVSYNTHAAARGTGNIKVSSEYWYTQDGVIRGSDHWGEDVASCSWFIKGERYSDYGVSKSGKRYAFISWKDLKAKGLIGHNQTTKELFTIGFAFEK